MTGWIKRQVSLIWSVVWPRAFWLVGMAALEAVAIWWGWGRIKPALLELADFNGLGTILAMLIAAPVAFVVWLYRDSNNRHTIQTAREDLFQKDFHQLQQWATETSSGNDALRLSAITQLRTYIRGERGQIFQRPTVEIYKAITRERQQGNASAHIQAVEEIFAELLYDHSWQHQQENRETLRRCFWNATYTKTTKFPAHINPSDLGMILVDESGRPVEKENDASAD